MVSMAACSSQGVHSRPPATRSDAPSSKMQDWMGDASWQLGNAVQRYVLRTPGQHGFRTSGMVRVLYRVAVDANGAVTAAEVVNPPELTQLNSLILAAAQAAEPLSPPPELTGSSALPVQMVLSMAYSPPVSNPAHRSTPF
ncbi:energy transducer TonB family protein [Pseudoroseomonas ludipueritiae]